MFNLLDYPYLVLVVFILLFWISARIGGSFRKQQNSNEDGSDDFTFLLGSTLTLLGLIIGFTFSMAVSRYDQRKNLEAEEANAIGTEYLRANLSPSNAARVQALLKDYLDQRIVSYRSRDAQPQISVRTGQLQTEMWSAVVIPAAAQPTPLTPLVLAGMNDVLNSQGYSQAASWNRIPIAAWTLLTAISIFCNLLVGYRIHRRSAFLFLILPIVLSISLFLIADIDSPRHGVIRVRPQNLESLAESLHSQ